MSFSLKLELHQNNKVIVTNPTSQEKKEVTLNYIQEVTRNPLDSLIQYKYYEICINAENIWNQVKYFDPQAQAAKEVDIERKFRDIMVNDGWIKITSDERAKYKQALLCNRIYDFQKSVGKTLTVINQFKKFNW